MFHFKISLLSFRGLFLLKAPSNSKIIFRYKEWTQQFDLPKWTCPARKIEMQRSAKRSSVYYPFERIKVPVCFFVGALALVHLSQMSPWSPNWTSSAVVSFFKVNWEASASSFNAIYGSGFETGLKKKYWEHLRDSNVQISAKNNTNTLAHNSLIPTSGLSTSVKAFDIKHISSSWFRFQNQKRFEQNIINTSSGSVLVHQLLQRSGSCHQDTVPVPSNRQCLGWKTLRYHDFKKHKMLCFRFRF